ncbi:unnamed protein product [Auanema sp. JU1783]|nr:unnamed protein product [Auanema sp. JU1783]
MNGGPRISSIIRSCEREISPILEGFGLIFRSQLGYEGRKVGKKLSRKCLQIAVNGGTIIDPQNKAKSISPVTDVLERAHVVATGIKTFAQLLSQGLVPGMGGYTINSEGEKVYGSSSFKAPDVVQNLSKVADLVKSGAMQLPLGGLPNLLKLGELATKAIDTSSPSPLFSESFRRGRKVKPIEVETSSAQPVESDTGLTPEEEQFLIKAAESVNDKEAVNKILTKKSNVYRPSLPDDFKVEEEDRSAILANSKESKVPSSRIGRFASFGQLAIGLAGGAAAEITRRTFGMGDADTKSPFLSTANGDRIVQTLCRVRGAALKLGQMLSIQDPETVSPALLEIFERVRQSADFMPSRQVSQQMEAAFGENWRDHFESFEERPFAAASIGEVHKAILKDGRAVAVKIQYPGVAAGIDSDIDNLVSVLSVGGIVPSGMYLDAFVAVARRELRQECDYLREARAMREFKKLLAGSNDYYVPEVIDELSTDQVLTTEFIVGKPVDKCLNEPQVVRDYIAGKFIELCLNEIFVWRFMQTDPNWSNFYLGVHPTTGEPRLILLDFGASRSYGKQFVDKYMKIIKAAYDSDDEKILEYSRDIGFLTGYENQIMNEAHIASIKIISETLTSDHPYDFSQQTLTKRIHDMIPVMLENRLTSPPEEIYSLHRKLAGSYLLAVKLKATVSCGGLFHEIYSKYKFGDESGTIDIDNVK